MNRRFVKDMTTGDEFKLLIGFSVPMLIGNLFQQVYNMVDSIVVGKYVGADSLAAVGATGSLNFLFFSLCIGLSGGIGVVISQHFGAGDETNVRKTIFNSIYIIATAGLVMSLLGVCFARPILTWLRTPANILDDATAYMQIVSGGLLAVAAYNCISSILRALGDSRTPLFFLIFASLVNVILDLVLVIFFGLGVRGVAYATITAQVLSAAGSLAFAIKKNPYFLISRDEMHYDTGIASKCYRLGLPLALQSSLIAISCVALQSVVNTFGSTVVAAFTATSRIEQLVQQPFNSLGMALSTFTGQNMGAGKLDRVKRAFAKSVLVVSCFSLLMLAVFHVFGNGIMKIFVSEPSVIEFGTQALKITSWFYLFLGMIYIVRGLLNGAGDAVYSMINGCVEVFGRIVFSNTLVLIPSVGKWGVWLATALTWCITGIASLIRFKQGKWKTIRVVDRKEKERSWNTSKESHTEPSQEPVLLRKSRLI
ncbi:MAG: MATE family efflux transporter [Lachnospiraceae bacterium]|nr:MATE family efflux transporter [Lachnospiraceae bacterium]